jgi:hypothetical protein
MNLDRPLSYEATVRLVCALGGFFAGLVFSVVARSL